MTFEGLKNIILENWGSAILSLILASYSFFYLGTLLPDGALGLILGFYATILSIIVSATFVGAQVTISKFGTEIWKNYINDKYIQFYFYLFPVIFVPSIVFLFLNPDALNIVINIHNFTIPYILINISKYGLIGFLTAILIFLIIFSLLILPKYLKNVVNILNPEEQIRNNLRIILRSGKYNTKQKKTLEAIKNILNDLSKNENYETLKSCLRAYVCEFENIPEKKSADFDKFTIDSIKIMHDMSMKKYPKNSKVRREIMNTLKDISIILNSNEILNEVSVKALTEIVLEYINNPFSNEMNTIVNIGSNSFLELIKKINKKEKKSESNLKNLKTIIRCNFNVLDNLLSYFLTKTYNDEMDDKYIGGYFEHCKDILGITEAFEKSILINNEIIGYIKNNDNFEEILHELLNGIDKILSKILNENGKNDVKHQAYTKTFGKEKNTINKTLNELNSILEYRKYGDPKTMLKIKEMIEKSK